MTESIVIYRKDVGGKNWADEYGPKAPTKTAKAEADRRLDLVARVRRPELESFLRDGFYKLEALAPKIIDNRPERIINHSSKFDCWVIPAGSLGRKFEKDANAEPARSDAQSVLLWIKQNMGHVVNPDHVSIVIQ